MRLDADLQSIQGVRNLLHIAKLAQPECEKQSQSQIDAIVLAMSEAAQANASRLAAMAVEETGFGRVDHKSVKNFFAAKQVQEEMKEIKTVGIIRRDERSRVWEVAQPVGIVAGIVPSTNPTSTVIFKSLIAVKARNAIVFSPHPAAVECCAETARVLQAAAERAGAPSGLIQCISQPTMGATNELMTHPLTDLILATGGSGLVKAAYSSGKPAYGVGPGNVPVYIHSSADIPEAVRLIMQSKTFDYGTICASEQAVIVDQEVKERVVAEFVRQGAYFLNEKEKEKVAAVLVSGNSLNPKVVGRSPQMIGNMAGIMVPSEARLLIAEEQRVGKSYPFSIEKLCPVLAFYTVPDWREGCSLCIHLLELGGLGHSLGIHCSDEAIIEAFGLEKPASRIIVNAGTTFGAIGASTGLFPSMTLGCGSFGNNITSDNIGPEHLMNIKRVAFGIREMQLPEQPIINTADTDGAMDVIDIMDAATTAITSSIKGSSEKVTITREEVMNIIKQVLHEMNV